MKLLNIDRNSKTVKGQDKGYMTAVLYLAPWKAAGVNLCPAAELAGCFAGCLNTAGRGGIARAAFTPYGVELPDNSIQRARVARTRFFVENRDAFMAQLVREIAAFVRKARRKGLVPVVRLNGTSDIRWENVPVPVTYVTHKGVTTVYCGPNIMTCFPDVQFYDYTKLPGRLRHRLPANYHLAVSWSGASAAYAAQAEAAFLNGASLVVVADSEGREYAKAWAASLGRAVIDGDEHDLRFTDPRGALVLLKPKGAARKDRSGFVLRGDRDIASRIEATAA